jgi:hypothetical protein
MTSTEHIIRTRSAHAYLVARLFADGTVETIGYAVNETTARRRCERERNAGRYCVAARIIDGTATFTVTTVDTGRVTETLAADGVTIVPAHVLRLTLDSPSSGTRPRSMSVYRPVAEASA